MKDTHERPEVNTGGADDTASREADDVARRRVLEFDARLTTCEHDDVSDAAAVRESAKAIEQWDHTTDPAVRERLLGRVGREMMVVHEAPPPELHAKELEPQLYGAYVDEDFRIDANSALLGRDDPTDALETYLHEYRHAEQAYEVQKSHGPLSHSVDPERAAALEFNSAHYLRPADGQDAYERQLLESDARTFAERKALEILEQRDRLRADREREGVVPLDADEIAARRIGAARGEES